MNLRSLAIFAMLSAIGFQIVRAADPPKPNYTANYKMLEDRNIFLRDRSRPSSRNGSSSTQPTRRLAEDSLILRGIVFEDDGFRAYIEDMGTSSMIKLAVGDAIARGKVSVIGIDAVAYDLEGQRVWVEIGSNLAGKAITFSSSSSAAPTTGPSIPSDVANLKLDDPNLTTEQRLKLKRLQEMSPK